MREEVSFWKGCVSKKRNNLNLEGLLEFIDSDRRGGQLASHALLVGQQVVLQHLLILLLDNR